MMRALARLGHEVSLLTGEPPRPEAVAGLALAAPGTFGDPGWPKNGHPRARPTPRQERLRSHSGASTRPSQAGRAAGRAGRAEAVVVVGLTVLPWLAGVEGALRVWYAADEWAWHHLSLIRLTDRSTWGHVKAAAVKGLYERAYAPLLDRVWVVSEGERRAMRWVTGVRGGDLLPKGGDGDHFRPQEVHQAGRSGAFWGRLDFEPNVQALEWFCGRVWPAVRRQAPDARFTVYGFQPTSAVRALDGRDGVQVVPDLPDLRPEVARHAVVVL